MSLGSFHVFVGPNASGKSTFFDVIAFFKDVLELGVEHAVRARAETFQELVWQRKQKRFELALELAVPASLYSVFGRNGGKYTRCRYEIALGLDPASGIRLLAENFFLLGEAFGGGSTSQDVSTELFPFEPSVPESIVLRPGKHAPPHWRKVISLNELGTAYFRSEITKWNFPQRPAAQKAALALVPEEERFPVSNWARRVLTEGVQTLALATRAMREPCRPDAPLTFRPDGSNIPVVVRYLAQTNQSRFKTWLAHIQTVLPDVQMIEVRERQIDLFPYLVIRSKSGLEVPSWLLSDGTLRLLALTLLAYLPTDGHVYLIEEPENGIHPKAVEAVYQSLSSVYDGQVLCATHSPLFLGLTKPEDLLCFAVANSGATAIVRWDRPPGTKKLEGPSQAGNVIRSRCFGMKDLITLVPDKNIEVGLRELFSRYDAPGIQRIEFDIFRHPHHDPGVFWEAEHFLSIYTEEYRYALVLFDREGSGQEQRMATELEDLVQQKLGKKVGKTALL